MMYTTLTINNRDYKCRLGAKNCVDLEKKLGTNPLNVFMTIADNSQLPKMETLIYILHASLQQYNHGMSLDDTYNLYDEFVEEGHTIVDLIPIILEIFKVSGFFHEGEADPN